MPKRDDNELKRQEELDAARERIAQLEREISGPHQADALRDSEARFRVLVENSPDVITTLDRDATIQFINYTLPHLSVEQVVGTSVLQYVQEADRPRYERAFAEVLQSGSSRSLELPAEGATWWLTRLIPIKTDGDEVEAVLVIATDITERKRSEEALRESENKFRALAETTTAAIFMFQGAQMLYANPAAEQITGYSHDEILHMTFWDVIHPDFRDLVKERGLARQEHADVPARWEVKLRTKAGEARWVDYVGTPFEYSGRPAVLGTAVDITERRQAEDERRNLEAQVRHAQKLESLGVLAGGIAHDFNNLLTGILGSASLAIMKIPDDSPAKEQLQRILTASEKAAELTNQMLAYAGKGRFVVGPVDLNQLVQEVIALVRTSISKKTKLRESFAENLPNIEADKTQLHQVLMNLITNASEALDGNEGDVLIRTGALEARSNTEGPEGPEGGKPVAQVFLEVSDTGAGMDVDTKDKIFDPFFTTKFTGRGLGLAAVQGIVRAHGGTIRVDSKPHRGTTFTVLFPASSRRRPPILEDVESPRVFGGTGTILVIDDEEIVRTVARGALEETGYSVVLASDGHEAIEIFGERSDEIDAVLLDLSMPRMSGEETLTELRSVRPQVRVVLTSGHSEQEIAEKFAGKGLAGFVQKPFRASELVDKIHAALTNPRPSSSSSQR